MWVLKWYEVTLSTHGNPEYVFTADRRVDNSIKRFIAYFLWQGIMGDEGHLEIGADELSP